MPLEHARYRYKPGTKIRLAFDTRTGAVKEAKNMATGATHTPKEFAADHKNVGLRRIIK